MTLMVSDHAVCRYLERVLGIDMDHLRAQILGSCVRPYAARLTMGGPTDKVVVNSNGVRFVIENGAVITVLEHKHQVKRFKGQRVIEIEGDDA
jgi:hypothetical protein